MLGLKRGTVSLVSDHNTWSQLFDAEKNSLEKILGDNVVAIKHVGSTAIKGVLAKPIIDIRIAMRLFDDKKLKHIEQILNSLGYTRMHDFPGRIFFAKGPEEKRTYYISLVKEDDEREWDNTILFRDYLRNHEEAREAYNQLKQTLLKKYADNRTLYTKGKEDFIENIIYKAKLSFKK